LDFSAGSFHPNHLATNSLIHTAMVSE